MCANVENALRDTQKFLKHFAHFSKAQVAHSQEMAPTLSLWVNSNCIPLFSFQLLNKGVTQSHSQRTGRRFHQLELSCKSSFSQT